jgi:hypothetical protein
MILNWFLEVVLFLIFALALTTKSALNMIESKRLLSFLPFLFSGIIFCLASGLLYYNLYHEAHNISVLAKITAYAIACLIVWRRKWD